MPGRRPGEGLFVVELHRTWGRRPLLAALAGLLPAVAAMAAPPPKLHVPSPDWRDQVVYFVVTDRFDDGDASNNDQGAGEYRPGSQAHYQGGDFAGLRRRLDYIRGLGATALWITPPVRNRWWDAPAAFSGYHGYWTSHFKEVDPHLGTLDDYRALSSELHQAGMYLVQDVVVNHMGNFFHYGPDWTASDPARGWQPVDGVPMRPSQPPFDRNDPRDAAQRRDGIYHWTPDVRDHRRRAEELTFQMSGLDDLNTENPVVRRALRDSFGHWIREVGVDALRIDTALYVPEAFFDDFLQSADPRAPGLARVARQTGRRHLLTFGEGFAIDAPYSDVQARRLERYATRPDGRPRLSSMINFPLYGSLRDVFARGAPPAELAHRIGSMMRVHRDPHTMPSFVDNHDVDRFLAGGSPAALKQALLAIFALPGIPVVYYGTEQGFTEPRASMFAAGAGSGGRDRFDTTSDGYRYIAALAEMRRTHRLFSRGRPEIIEAQAAGPGVIAWRMRWGREAALVVMNTADTPALLAGLPTGAAAGSRLEPLLALDGAAEAVQVDRAGRLTRALPARGGWVWRLPTAAASTSASSPVAATVAGPRIERLRAAADGLHATVAGRAPPGRRLQLVVDGRLDLARETVADEQGRWQLRLGPRELDSRGVAPDGPGVRLQLHAWLPDEAVASPPRTLALQRPWTVAADVTDPAGDDHGRDGRTLYPTDRGWGANRQLDLRRVQVWRAGGALRITLTMAGLTQGWNPPHGFDRVVFTMFFAAPGRDDGASVMPGQDGELPGGQRWHWRLRAHGWSNAWFGHEGADAVVEGRSLSPGAALSADLARRTVTFSLPATAFGPDGAPPGLRLWINTWDYDGGYRARAGEAGPYTFGGGPGPKVMDEAGPIVVR